MNIILVISFTWLVMAVRMPIGSVKIMATVHAKRTPHHGN